MSIRPEQPEPFLRGCVFPAVTDAPYPRADPAGADYLPADVWAAAQLPVGVRLELVGNARTIRVWYQTTRASLGYRGESAGCSFVAYRAGQKVAMAEAIMGEGMAELVMTGRTELPVTIYLPEGMVPLVTGVAGVEDTMVPAPLQPRWLAYGDAVTQGWLASAPAMAWPAVAGRKLGLDVCNLGYAGTARGETTSALMLAETPAEVISIAFGLNNWSRVPHTPPLMAEEVRCFLAVVRQGHPETPVVVVSPTARPDAENEPNRVGATLAQLRKAMEETVRARIDEGDKNLFLIEGRNVVDPADLEDGIYPGDEGHRRLAAAISKVLVPQLADLQASAEKRWAAEGISAIPIPVPVPLDYSDATLSTEPALSALSPDFQSPEMLESADLLESESAEMLLAAESELFLSVESLSTESVSAESVPAESDPVVSDPVGPPTAIFDITSIEDFDFGVDSETAKMDLPEFSLPDGVADGGLPTNDIDGIDGSGFSLYNRDGLVELPSRNGVTLDDAPPMPELGGLAVEEAAEYPEGEYQEAHDPGSEVGFAEALPTDVELLVSTAVVSPADGAVENISRDDQPTAATSVKGNTGTSPNAGVASAGAPIAPSDESPLPEVPIADGAVDDGQVAEGPVAEGPVAEGPVAEGPVAEGPVAEGPVAEGPVAEGPVAEGAPVDSQGVAGPAESPPPSREGLNDSSSNGSNKPARRENAPVDIAVADMVVAALSLATNGADDVIYRREPVSEGDLHWAEAADPTSY